MKAEQSHGSTARRVAKAMRSQGPEPLNQPYGNSDDDVVMIQYNECDAPVVNTLRHSNPWN